jgi:hypothetical protein
LYATPKGKDALAVVEELDDEDLNDSVDALCVPTILAESISGESATIARKYLRSDMENSLR